MNLFDVPEEDRWIVLLAAIAGIVIIGTMAFNMTCSSQEKADAFKNGYEQVYDPVGHQTLWKKKDQQQ